MKTRRDARAWVLKITADSLRKRARHLQEKDLPQPARPAHVKRAAAEMVVLAVQLERRAAKVQP